MSLKKQEENKKMSFKKILNSIKYSVEGLICAYKNEQSLWLHGICSIVVIIIGLALSISFYEWTVILIALAVVLSVELLNTAIEATVDLITKEIHPLAKIAKDCGSAATFVSAIITIIICLVIFLPKVIVLF